MASELAPGFLVAAPSLRDPNFERAVVLLVEHREEGSLGFVVNRPAGIRLAGIIEELGIDEADATVADEPVLVGGPVAPQTGWILFDHQGMTDPVEELVRVSSHLAVSASRHLLEMLVRGDGPERKQLVLGYSGWGPGQLDAELAQGAWIPVDLDERIVFEMPFDERWTRALRQLGIDPARLSLGSPSEA